MSRILYFLALASLYPMHLFFRSEYFVGHFLPYKTESARAGYLVSQLSLGLPLTLLVILMVIALVSSMNRRKLNDKINKDMGA